MNKLHDALTRLSLYVDNLRANKSKDFRKVTKEVQEIVFKEFDGIKYDTMDGLSKVELNRFVVKLRKSLYKVYLSLIHI